MAQDSTGFPAAQDTFVAGEYDGSIALAVNAMQAYIGPTTPTAITVLGATMPDDYATSNLILSTGVVQLTAMNLQAGITIKNFLVVSSVQSGTLTHGWMALFDTAYKVVATSADVTSGTTPAAGSLWTLAVANCVANSGVAAGANTQFITTRAGLYYFGVMCTSAGTLPTFSAGLSADANGRGAMVPYLAGLSTAAATTPPSVTTVVAQTTPSTASKGYLAYVS